MYKESDDDEYDVYNEPYTVEINELRFELTCSICPEQYDVYMGSRQVAYVRLRWGNLTVTMPDVGGVYVYDHQFDDEWKGCFDSSKERKVYLNSIAETIRKVSEATAV
jgi:hypothetical protein